MSAGRKALDLVTAVVGLAIVSHIVLRPDGAAIIRAQSAGIALMIKVATAERAIVTRDIPRVETLLGEMNDEVMTELFAGLNDADLDWVESHLSMGAE